MAVDPHDLNRLAAFAEDRLDESERQQFVAHLAGCAECRATLAAYVRAAVPAEAAAVATDSPSSWRSWMSIAATLAVLTIGGLVALLNRDATVPPAAVDPSSPGPKTPAVDPPGTTHGIPKSDVRLDVVRAEPHGR